MKFINITLLAVLFLTAGTSLWAQTNNLEGRITDEKSGRPVQGAIIFLSYTFKTYSDNEGNYFVRNIPEGNYLLRISRLGYAVTDDSVRITPGTTRRDYQIVPSPIELDEILVTTDRTENYLRNSAYSELIKSSEQIEVRPFQTVSDALKSEPGLSLLRDGIWATEVNIRGLSRENVVTLIDGNRIVTSTDVAARLSLIDMNDIERVEIIKGASSTIYGSGATGGIVKIISKAPEFRNDFFFSGGLSGGFNSVNNSGLTSLNLLSGKSFWSTKLTASYRKADNTQTPTGELSNSQYEDYSLSAALNIKPFADNLLKINYQLFKAENVGIPGGSVFPGNAVVRYPDEERELISAEYEILNLTGVLYKLSAKYSYQFINRNVENIPNQVQSTPTRRVSVLKITPNADHKSNNVEVTGNLLFGKNNILIAGVDYWDRSYTGLRERYQKIEILNSSGEVTSTINRIIGEKPLPDSWQKNLGLFVQDEMELLENRLSLSLGARGDGIFIHGEEFRNPVYEIINGVQNPQVRDSVIWGETKTNSVSYSANTGIKYSLNRNIDFTLSLGLSFRSPSLEERFQFIDQGNFVRLGNPELKSELGRSADLGIRLYYNDLRLVTSVFYNYFRDLVVEEPGTFDGRPAYIKTNVGKAALYGVDMSIDYNFFRSTTCYLTASYVKGDDITFDKPLPGIPPLNTRIGLRTFLLAEIELDFSSNIFYKQIHPAAGEMSTPGYAVFDLALSSMMIELTPIELKVYAGVENIFDKAYRDHLATTRGSMRLEPGRNFYLKLVTRW